jgi:hypothetical protein
MISVLYMATDVIVKKNSDDSVPCYVMKLLHVCKLREQHVQNDDAEAATEAVALQSKH